MQNLHRSNIHVGSSRSKRRENCGASSSARVAICEVGQKCRRVVHQQLVSPFHGDTPQTLLLLQMLLWPCQTGQWTARHVFVGAGIPAMTQSSSIHHDDAQESCNEQQMAVHRTLASNILLGL
jgi:hypothetical protein